ncbi:MAG TPA: FapA family protein [Bacillota bacterium]|nr:FapA family protein [Bacillota bacterium]
MVPENVETGMESGKVWIRDGRVFVRNPVGGGRAPTIKPCAEVDLFINGVKAEGKTSVSESDEIVLEPRCKEDPGFYRIKVAAGGLSAELELKMAVVERYAVRDAEPATDLYIEAVQQVEEKCPFGMAEIMQELAKRNITYGINHDRIQSIIENPENGIHLIAEGEPAGETVDDRIELTFSTELQEQKVSAESKKVNFRDVGEIPSVEPGAVLAVKHFGVQGNPGKKVTGEAIPPAKLQIIELTGGKGVEISPDGGKAVARVAGRPVVKKLGSRYVIDVEPVLQKKGDVDISSGNIRFKGDVVVQGNVCEGMTVQAAGKINILGMIFEARIGAQGDITAMQNITGSSIVAGGNNSFFKAFYKILDDLCSDFTEIVKLMPGLESHPKLKGVKAGQLIQLIVDKKFGRVPGLIGELLKMSEQNAFILPREIILFTEKIESKLSGINLLKLESVEELNRILSEVREVQRIINSMAQTRANITFGYSVNSKIEASGDIKVEGRGCINTSLQAGGNVSIKGVFRGGEIVARGDVFLNEAGSEMGAKTFIKTEDGKKIFIKKAYPGVQIQVGNRRANLTSLQYNIKAELDESGSLIVLSG